MLPLGTICFDRFNLLVLWISRAVFTRQNSSSHSCNVLELNRRCIHLSIIISYLSNYILIGISIMFFKHFCLDILFAWFLLPSKKIHLFFSMERYLCNYVDHFIKWKYFLQYSRWSYDALLTNLWPLSLNVPWKTMTSNG